MAISQAMVTSFKVEILNGIHAFGPTVVRAATTADTFKIALYTSSATLDATTTQYTGTTNEVAAGGNYTTGGITLAVSPAPAAGGTTAFLSFSDTTWATSTITARGALIYNDIQLDKAVAVLDFGSDRSSSGGNFTIQFPAADATNAILRIA
jgi:hypothetical protein